MSIAQKTSQEPNSQVYNAKTKFSLGLNYIAPAPIEYFKTSIRFDFFNFQMLTIFELLEMRAKKISAEVIRSFSI